MTSPSGPWVRYGIDGPAEHPIRLGLLVDDGRALPRWAAEAVRGLLDSGLATAVVVASPSSRLRVGPALSGARHLAFRLARATIWRSHWGASTGFPGVLADVPRFRVGLEPAGQGRRGLAPADLAALRDHRLDVLLRVGLDSLAGDVGGVAAHGVWSIRHGDPAAARGGPPGFWELYGRDPGLVVVLARATSRAGDAEELARAVLAVEPHSYPGTADRALRAGIDLLIGAFRDLVAGRLPAGEAVPASTVVLEPPGAAAVARVIASTVAAAVSRLVYGAFVLKQWSIGRLEGGAERALAGDVAGARWVAPGGRTRILADPVLVPGTAGRTVLCEALDHADGRGTIVAIDADATGKRRTVLDIAGVHLSYPAIVADRDRLVLMPEAAAARGLLTATLDAETMSVVELQRAPGLAAIDPTVFRHGDRWWLACTERGSTSGSHLWLFHAPTPLGPWTAHRRNPVRIDARAARGAGLPFTSNGVLYRPAQDLREGYGRSIRVMRVTALTPDAYEEEVAVALAPDRTGPYSRGIHTLAVADDVIWIDGYRTVVHPLAGWYRARARLRRSRAPELMRGGGWPA